MSFLTRLVLDNSRSMEKIELVHSSSATHEEKNCTGSEFFIVTFPSDLTFLAQLILEK